MKRMDSGFLAAVNDRRPGATARRLVTWSAVVGLILMLAAGLLAQATPPLTSPKLPSWSEQIRVRESWLPTRHEMILDLLRRHDIDMWIVVSEEFHDDPLTQYIAPPRPYDGNRDFFVFIDTGEQGLRKVAITGFAEENLRKFFESPRLPQPADKLLPELYAKHQPARIALNMAGRRGVQRSLTYDSYQYLSKTLGPEAASRFVSAADLIEEYLDTRIPEEFEYYTRLVQLTDVLARRSLSNEVITPGKTSVGDVRRWLYDQVGAHGVRTWFQPDLRVFKKGVDDLMGRRFPAVSDESTVIERGNVVHLDFGISYMGFDTDWQKDAYVLLEGEKDAPEGLRRAMANTNLLQDALIRASRPGRTSGDVVEQAMKDVSGKGFEPRIYCHPIGNQGHGLGTALDSGFLTAPPGQAVRPTKVLRKGTYQSIELNTATPVPEWNSQKIFIAFEDDAYLTDEGWKFFVPRQESYYLVK